MNKFLPILGTASLLWTGGTLQAEVLQLAAGDRQSVALVTGGDVFEWGEYGGLVPVPVFGLNQVTSLAAGAHHMLALGQDGSVWAWGDNSSGQLGDGSVIQSDRPGRVMDITGAVGIAAAANRSYALKNDGTIWAWGANGDGLLGDGTTHDRRGPVVVEGILDATAMAAGENTVMILRKDGSLCTLALSGPNCSSTTYHSVVAVAAEASGGYVLLRDGTVRTLGSGNCASGFRDNDIVLDDVKAIAAGRSHVLLLRDDGSLWACGNNASGQLGDATTESHNRPVQVGGGLVNVTRVAAGGAYSLAVNDGGVWTWGDNSAGQLGTGNTTPRPQPGILWDGTGRLR